MTTADSFQHWLQLGDSFRQQQRWTEAADAFRQALARDPTSASAWSMLGRAEQNLGRYDQAEQAFQNALAFAPGNVETLICYAFLLNQRSQPAEAIKLLEQALSQAPQFSLGWLVLGHCYDLLGNAEAAEIASRRAVECAPHDPSPRYQLANVLFFRWKLSDSLAEIRELLAIQPNHADAWSLYGLVLRAFFRHHESLDALRRSVAIARNPHTASKILAGLQYSPDITPQALLIAHRDWNAAYSPFPPGEGGSQRLPGEGLPSNPKSSSPPRPLRLGFLSADFGQHPTGFLVLPALERLDKQRCTLFCYSDRVAEDAYTARFRTAADHWRTTQGTQPEQLAEQIRRDQLDILFDMSGHFGERMPLLALQPAPIQISWFGYVGTTGLSAMNYLLVDTHHVRPDEEQWYTEKILRMPAGYACYQPPADTPDVAPLPALKNGHITFGCFNNPAKYSPAMFDAWADILRRVPTAHLMLKFGWLGDSNLRQQVQAEFAQRGIAADRLLLEAHSTQRELLATYGRIDLALDTQPYSGGLTTCEALWMGVPVITLPGKTFAGRHSTSHLTTAGYPQFIAADAAGYVELAVSWANRLDELAAIRSQLRDRLRQSPLCDAARFAADFLALLETTQTAP